MQEKTGESPYIEKSLVLGSFVAAPLALLATAVATALLLRWWAILAVPVAVAAWGMYYAASPRGDAKLMPISILLLSALGALALDVLDRRPLWGLLSLYVASLWFLRFTYVAGAALLRAFILRNARVFAWLEPDLVIRFRGPAAG